MMGEGLVGVISPWTPEVQLALNIKITMAMLAKRMDTAEFYRLSHKSENFLSGIAD